MNDGEIEKALTLISSESWYEATKHLIRLMKENPRDHLPWILLAKVNLAIGELDMAAEYLDQAEKTLSGNDVDGALSEGVAVYRSIIGMEKNLRSMETEDEAPFPYSDRPPYARWSEAVANRPGGDIIVQQKPRYTIDHATKIASAGSCFAQHIARWLIANGYTYMVTESPPEHLSAANAEALGYGLYSARYGNIYTPLQAVQLFDRAYGTLIPQTPPWRFKDGFVDPYRARVQDEPFPTLERYYDDLERHFAAVRTMFETCDLFIFTLGLTEAWRSRTDGTVFPVCPGNGRGRYDPGEHEFVNFTVEETEEQLDGFVERLKNVNPKARLLLTVSPVPLVATMEDLPVVQSTIYSKSVLRVAAKKIRERYPNVDYFASYEIITNTSADNYFLDDRRSVNKAGVTYVMDTFERFFCRSAEDEEEKNARHGELEKTPLDGPSVICDEEDAYDLAGKEGDILHQGIWEFYLDNSIHAFCPPDLKEGGELPKNYTITIAPGVDFHSYERLEDWLDLIGKASAESFLTLCFGASHTATTNNWPYRLRKLPRRKDGRSHAAVNFGVNGGNSMLDCKLAREVRETFKKATITPEACIFLVGANDVLHRAHNLYKASTSGAGGSSFLPDEEAFLHERGFLQSDGIGVGLKMLFGEPGSKKNRNNQYPVFRPSPAWETRLSERILFIIEHCKKEAESWEVPTSIILQPLSTANYYPPHGARIIENYGKTIDAEDGNGFLSWRKRNGLNLHAGEYFFMNPDHKLDCVLDLEGMYLAIEEGFEMRNEVSGGGFLNLSRCFLSTPLPEGMPFSKDAYHYSPAGNEALTRHIYLGCGLY